MTIVFTYITTDGDYNNPTLHESEIRASGIGEAAQIAYGEAENEDRACIAVFEEEHQSMVLDALREATSWRGAS